MERRSRIAAYAIARRDTQVLLVRASQLSDFPGTWWLPGGGVEHGEHPADTVIRELREETGLRGRVASEPLVLSDTVEIPDRGISLHSVRIVYLVEGVSGELTKEIGGTSDSADWIELDRLGQLEVQPFVLSALAQL